MERELPTLSIAGTEFVVDVENMQLREKGDPKNNIALADMRDTGDGYVFDYSPKSKNLPVFFIADDDQITVKIPEFVQLDPIGMAQKYGCPIGEIRSKKDFDLMVDQQELALRLGGRLTTVAILGHTFYVDIPMDMLRPKDDFLSKGIVFNDIDPYYDDNRKAYVIPYNPRTHEFQEPDYDTMTVIPGHLRLISFPHQRELDPVGVNRKSGLPPLDGLKETNIRSHFIAGEVDWKETGIGNIIRGNIHKQQEKEHAVKAAKKTGRRIRRGRGL